MKTTVDVVVVGGGVMGCAILYNLALRGVTDAVLLEGDLLASGSTGRSQGILRTHYSNEVTARMAWESIKVFQDFDRAVGGDSGYRRTGYLLIAPHEDKAALEENVAMQRRVGIDTEVVSPAEAIGIAPALSVRDDEVCAYEPESGYADPYSVTQAYARRARDLGARVHVGVQVTGIDVDAGKVTGVVTTQGRISTGATVVATGPWSKPFLAGLGVDLPLRTVRHQVVTLRRPEDRVPDHPAIGDQVNSLSARPDVGHLTLVGVGEDEEAAPDRYAQGVDTEVVEDVSRKISSRIPGMSHAIFRGGWSGLFTTTPDWHPVLDRVDGIDGLYCAVGFSGHGFKLSPMVGAVMAEMVLDGTATTIDVSMLDIKRFAEGRPLRSRYRMAVLA